MNISRLDLNLLRAFEALAQHGSVTRAARQEGVTQPAMSNALRRLRETLGDPLFHRRGTRLVLTPRAEAMRHPVREALQSIEAACFGDLRFDPATHRGSLRVALSEHWHFALLPRLLEVLDREAPGLDLLLERAHEDVVRQGLARAEVDMAIYLAGVDEPGLRAQTLIRDGYVGVIRQAHPLACDRLSLQQYAKLRLVVVTPAGPWLSIIHKRLRERGLEQEVALRDVHAQAALEIVSRTDLLAVVPAFIARKATVAGVRMVGLPVDVGPFELSLYHHEHNDSNRLHQWMRAHIVRLVQEIFGHASSPEITAS